MNLHQQIAEPYPATARANSGASVGLAGSAILCAMLDPGLEHRDWFDNPLCRHFIDAQASIIDRKSPSVFGPGRTWPPTTAFKGGHAA